MNRTLILSIAAVAGAAVGAAFLPRPATADPEILTVFGSAPATADSKTPLSFVFRDRQTGDVVHRATAEARIEDGDFFARVPRGPLKDGSLYAVSLRTDDGATIASSFVNLQATTPGTAQIGNVNILGTVRAGRVVVSSNLTPVSATNTATTGAGVAGHFSSAGNAGRGITSMATSTTGTTFGGIFNTASPHGAAVRALSTGTGGSAIGVDAEARAVSGFGLRALNTLGSGASMTGFRVGAVVATTSTETDYALEARPTLGSGVWGVNVAPQGAGGDEVRGLRAVVEPGNGNFAVFSVGDTGATGTKSFLIDHPLDPANKDLRHYSAEGPEPLLEYQGNVTLGADGTAWVRLPAYFGAINRDPRYQLTPIGAAMPNLHVASEVRDDRFRIAGGRAGGKVTWTVTGVRNDLRVRQMGAPTETMKPDWMRGFFRDPERFGFGQERGEDGARAALRDEVARSQNHP